MKKFGFKKFYDTFVQNFPVLFKNLFKYIRVALPPLLLGGFFSGVWLIIPREKFGLTLEDIEEYNIAIGFLGLSHGILATGVLTSVWKKNDRLIAAIKGNDRATFTQLRDIRVPDVVHFLLFCFSSLLTLVSLSIPAKSIFIGCGVTFITVFIVTLWWRIARELDDPFHGEWILAPPADWLNGSTGDG